jgi:hypothetical protein
MKQLLPEFQFIHEEWRHRNESMADNIEAYVKKSGPDASWLSWAQSIVTNCGISSEPGPGCYSRNTGNFRSPELLRQRWGSCRAPLVVRRANHELIIPRDIISFQLS